MLNEHCDLLLEDFPEALFPIQALDGIANRCNEQLDKGERTHIGWTAREVVLPTLKPNGWLQREESLPFVRDNGVSKASGAIIKVAGITGRIRRMKSKRADSRTVRPTLVVLDGRGSRVERVGFAWERGKVSEL